MSEPILIYGANGYTGELVAESVAARGLPAVLSGRRRDAVEAVAARVGLPARAVALEDTDALRAAVREASLVLHCAGPFARTARPMVDACLATGRHYLDVTGEAEVFAAIAKRDAEAREAGVMMMPGVGFDVVPSDCLAAHLARRLPGARRLRLAFLGIGRPSRGTATTMAENAGRGGLIRRDGQLRRVPAAWRTIRVDFGRGPVACVGIPWGDVVTAYQTTGIPDIEVFMAAPTRLRLFLRASRFLGPVLRSAPVQRRLRAAVRRGPAGPSVAEREAGSSHLWGEVSSDDGRRATARLHGPEGYSATVACALEVVERVLAGGARPGCQTPAGCFGPDLALAVGFTREDLSSP